MSRLSEQECLKLAETWNKCISGFETAWKNWNECADMLANRQLSDSAPLPMQMHFSNSLYRGPFAKCASVMIERLGTGGFGHLKLGDEMLTKMRKSILAKTVVDLETKKKEKANGAA